MSSFEVTEESFFAEFSKLPSLLWTKNKNPSLLYEIGAQRVATPP